jgi:hypothetical protein
MTKKALKAINQGDLKIGDKKLECAVLEDGTRIISRNAIFRAFGRTKRGRASYETRVPNMPSFMDAKNLQSFISEDLRGGLKPIEYQDTNGKVITGYNAEILPLICEAYLAAREAGILTKRQLPLAVASEILIRSFSKIGIIALVDEATGYQEDRARDELQKILKAYISDELLPWTRRFPTEFYRQMFKLRGWRYPPTGDKGAPRGPRYAGKLTKELIYEKLPDGVLRELEELNPPDGKWQRKHRHHQWLTSDIGNPHLEKQVAIVTTLMKASSNWRQFERLFKRAFSEESKQTEMKFIEEENFKDDKQKK